MANEQPDELVILVHGTFAGDESDEGDRWWQRGSSTWRALTKTLPKGTRLPDGRLFHWTGANTQSERLSASMDLLVRLIDLERQGIRYHLVGHSHGGSVIWEALVSAQIMTTQQKIADPIWEQLTDRVELPADFPIDPDARGMDAAGALAAAEKRKRERLSPDFLAWAQLRGLRSVTTVGTPFLRFLPESTFLRYQGWRSRKFSLAGGGTLRRHRMVRLFLRVAGFSTAIGGLLLLGWMLVFFQTAWVLLAYPFIFVASGIPLEMAERMNLADSLVVRERAWRQVFDRFSGRWLGLWAPTDEAITVLRTAAEPKPPGYVWLCTPHTVRDPEPIARRTDYDLNLPIKKKAKMSDVSGFVPDTYAKDASLSFLSAIWRFVFNAVIGPWLSRQASSTLYETVQGRDVFNTSLVYASPWPLPLPDPPPGLPDGLAERLAHCADEKVAVLSPEIRQVVAYAALNGLPLARLKEWGWGKLPVDQALLHTAYFDDSDVLALINFHIERNMEKPPRGDKARSAANPRLTAWLDQNAVEVAARLTDFRSRVPD
ncbi:alpha/beta fold hydrolase [Streptomyces sp. NPDC059597]|uniref:alpha/beta fold hydrolase n=1 Tax=Streptomyces sp. NPDC059597 TaxID=3346879 RepID=UPI0036A9C766